MKSFPLFVSISFILSGCTDSYGQSTLLNTFRTDQFGGASISVKVGGLLFSAFDEVHGRELWCSDGTIAGTHMVKDIQPGLNNGIGDYFQLTSGVMDGILYFRGNDGVTGVELWRSDGTEEGTYLVKDVNPGTVNALCGPALSNYRHYEDTSSACPNDHPAQMIANRTRRIQCNFGRGSRTAH